MQKCPREEPKPVRASEVFDVDCPACGKPIEFFGDDTVRRCPSCGHATPNPRLPAAPAASASSEK